MKKLLNTASLDNNLAVLILRVLFGGMFIYYGYGKIVNYDQYIMGFKDYTGLGITASYNLVIFAEFFCGIFIALGLLTRFSVIPTFITMVVAFFVAHAEDDFQIKGQAFVYMILCIVIFLFGSGKYSLDQLIFNRKTAKNNLEK